MVPPAVPNTRGAPSRRIFIAMSTGRIATNTPPPNVPAKSGLRSNAPGFRRASRKGGTTMRPVSTIPGTETTPDGDLLLPVRDLGTLRALDPDMPPARRAPYRPGGARRLPRIAQDRGTALQ